MTTNFLSTSDKGKIFYEDPQTGKVSIMLHPSDSWQPVRFGLIKGSTGNGRYNHITGFDEIQITFRILQRTDGSVDYSA